MVTRGCQVDMTIQITKKHLILLPGRTQADVVIIKYAVFFLKIDFMFFLLFEVIFTSPLVPPPLPRWLPKML